MKIVIIADCLITQRAGIHYYARQFINRAIKQYQEHDFWHITPEPYEIGGSINIVIPINKRWPLHYRLRYFTAMPKEIKKTQADIAIEMAHFGPFSLPSSIKRIVMVHDLTPILYPKYHSLSSVIWHKIFFKRLVKKADAVIVNSHTTKRDLINHFKINDEFIYVNYPKTEYLTKELSNETSVRKNQSFDTPQIRLVTTGTIEPRKNHKVILEALKKTTEEFEWTIIGQVGWKSKPFTQALSEYAGQHKIRQLGYINAKRLSLEYERADILIYASEYEGFGMPIIEAMRYGLGLILSDTPIHREVAGDAARYFKNVEELAVILNALNEAIVKGLQTGALARFSVFKDGDLKLPFLN